MPGAAVRQSGRAWVKFSSVKRNDLAIANARLRAEDRRRERSFHKELRTINRDNPRNRR